MFLVNWSVALTSLGTMCEVCVVPLFVAINRSWIRSRYRIVVHARYLHGRFGDGGSTVSVDQMLQSNVTFFEDLNRLVKKKCYIFRIRVARDLVFL